MLNFEGLEPEFQRRSINPPSSIRRIANVWTSLLQPNSERGQTSLTTNRPRSSVPEIVSWFLRDQTRWLVSDSKTPPPYAESNIRPSFENLGGGVQRRKLLRRSACGRMEFISRPVFKSNPMV